MILGRWARTIRQTLAGRRKLLLAGAALALVAGGSWALSAEGRLEQHLREAHEAYRRRQFDLAREHLARALRAQPNSPEAHLLLAGVARRANSPDEARVRLDVCELVQVPRALIDLEWSLLAVQEGDLSASWTLSAYARDQGEEAVPVLEALARGYQVNYQLDAVMGCVNAWLEREPDCPHALLMRGWAREQDDHFDEAAADYARAAAADPHLSVARLRLAQAYTLMQQAADALPLFEGLAAERPGDAEVGCGLAGCLRRLNRPAEALRVLDGLLPAHAGDYRVHLEAGQALAESGDPAGAEPRLRRAVELAPHDHQARFALFRFLAGQGRVAEAKSAEAEVKRVEGDLARMRELTNRLRARPDDPDLRCEIGRLFLATGEAGEGERWLNSALRIDPHHRPSHQALAEHYARSGRTALAARHRRQAS